jgi:LysR family glycine cleavage system transcriptional activator
MEDDWSVWLTAAGLSPKLSTQSGLTFDLQFMTVQAAIDGLGVAIGRTAIVESDLAKGRLVAPFEMTLPAAAGYYLVCPHTAADAPKITAFRDWLIATSKRDKHPLALVPSESRTAIRN